MDPDYEIFAAIVGEGSLSAAGRRLSISPAMVSKRLARLEHKLGARLLHRSTRRLAPTAQGERLHADLQGIFAAIGEAERRARGGGGAVAGPLRVSAPTSFGRMHLAPHMGVFLDRYPAVDLTLDLSDEFVDLFGARVDVALRISASVPQGLVVRSFGPSERVLCAAPAYLAAHGEPAGVADLADHRLLAASGQLPWRLDGPEGAVAVDGVSHVRTNSSEVVRELALSGAGIALRSLWDVNDALADGRLRRILPDHEGAADISIAAVHLPGASPPAALTAFLDFLDGLYRPVPPWKRGGDGMSRSAADQSIT